jgi:hypothetical protein
MTTQEHEARQPGAQQAAGDRAGRPDRAAEDGRVVFVTAIAKLLGWRGLILVGTIALLGAVSLFGLA